MNGYAAAAARRILSGSTGMRVSTTDRMPEREANVLDAELLMPEAVMRAAWRSLVEPNAASVREPTVRSAAALFDVSTSAVWYRLYSLALVPSKPDVGVVA